MDKSPFNKDNNTYVFDVAKKSYTIVDNWLFDSDLSEHEKMVYIVLKRYAIQPERIFPSQATIATSASLSVRSVIRALQGLQKKGLVLIQSQANVGRSNVYFLCSPDQTQALKQDNLNLLESMTESHRGMTESHRGMTESHRGMTESHRGMTESHRGMTESHTINTIKNTIKTTTTTLLCFECKKKTSQKIQITIDGIEQEVCGICGSLYIYPLDAIPIKTNKLTQILNNENVKKVYTIIDIINYQYKDKEIKSYESLLMGMLKREVIPPEGYIPYHERKLQEVKRKMTEAAKRAAEVQKEKEEKDYWAEADRRLNKLTKEEYTKLREDVLKEIPAILQNIEGAVLAAMRRKIMGEE